MPDPIFTEEKIEYKKEPLLETNFEYTEENKAAIIKYRELCRHIAKSISQPELYLPIKYNIEQDDLIAYLQVANGPITKINVTKVMAHLDGRFDTALEGMPEFNSDDGTKFIEVQKALTNQQGSIFRCYISNYDSLRQQFLKFTSKFWFGGPYHEFNSFLWSDPKIAQYITRPNNFNLFIFMPLAITKYLTITRSERHGLQELLQRAEGEFNTDYKKGLKIRTQFPRSFSLGLPYSMGSVVGKRFASCEYLIVLDEKNQNDYVGGELHSDGSDVSYDSDDEGEKEILLESSVIIEVLDVQVKPVFHHNQRQVGKETYTEVRIAVRRKPTLKVPEDLSINPAVMSLFSETLKSIPTLPKRVIPTKIPNAYAFLNIMENQPARIPAIEVKSVPSVDNTAKSPQPLLPVTLLQQNPKQVLEVKSAPPAFDLRSSSSLCKPAVKPADLNAVSALELIDLLKMGTKSATDLFKTIPLQSTVWQNQQLIDTVLLTHKFSFVEWLQASSVFNDMQDANCIILASNALSIIKEHIDKKNIHFIREQAPWLQKIFFNLCKTIAKDPNPVITCGEKQRDLLEQLIQVILSVNIITGYTEDTLNQQFHQTLNSYSLKLRSFTPVQLLVVLEHTKALTLIADKGLLDLKTEAHFNPPAASMGPWPLLNLAMNLGFKQFNKVHQLSAAKAHLKEIEAERPWIDFGGKQSRINACKALIQYIQQGRSIPEEHRSTLSKSTLRDIASLNPIAYGSAALTMHMG